MSEMAPEIGPDDVVGETVDVTCEASVTDGVFRIDYGIEDRVLLTMQYAEGAAPAIPQILQLALESWEAAHERIIEARTAAQAAEAETEGGPVNV